MSDPPAYPGPPRWVKRAGIAAAALVLLAVVLALAAPGRHGPGRHIRSGDGGPASRAVAAGPIAPFARGRGNP